ncbi:hypothetical protein C5167_021072 [Papaver somniferum]|uniref:Uncharacterized protein n=1 Tax=Papaver somniferum TaxID=3469 RepID=A0A4Y7IVC3_PAPSO|nr:hypothetical protein C5167_021072 [Papaver somniferum]
MYRLIQIQKPNEDFSSEWSIKHQDHRIRRKSGKHLVTLLMDLEQVGQLDELFECSNNNDYSEKVKLY